jgi:hypothetical protein
MDRANTPHVLGLDRVECDARRSHTPPHSARMSSDMDTVDAENLTIAIHKHGE